MADKDIISKQVLKRILVDVATYVFGLQLNVVELIETEQQRIEDRRADLTAKVVDKQGNRFILHIEIQNRNQKNMPDRMLRYLSDIRLNYPGVEVFQYLLYIGFDRLTMMDGIETRQLNYRYAVIDMHDIDYKMFMEQESPDALVMAILCDFKGEPIKNVIHQLLTKLIRLTQNDSKMLREYISMLEIMASNRDININIKQEFEMLHIEVEKLPSFLMGEERGREEGRKEGRKEGEKRKAYAVAKRLLAAGMQIEQIALFTDLDKAEIEKIIS